MKFIKIASFLLFVMFFSYTVYGAPGAAQETRVTIGEKYYVLNGKTYYMDAAPYISRDSTMVPLRFIAYAFGLSNDRIIWNDADKTATINAVDKIIKFTVNSPEMYVNGKAVLMSNPDGKAVAPEIKTVDGIGRIYIPLRALGDAFGVSVDWEASARTAIFNKSPGADNSSYNVIVFNSILLGSWNGAWVDNKTTAASLRDLLTYTLYDNNKYLSIAAPGNTVTEFQRNPNDKWPESAWTERIMIYDNGNHLFTGLALSKHVDFGKFEEIDVNSPFYSYYIRNILADRGLPDENIHIQQIIRTDLENDGVDEVLINASNYDYNDKKRGMYSLAVMSKIIGGAIKTVTLLEDIKPRKSTFDRDKYSIYSIADFNSDGRMEILTGYQYDMGFGYCVFAISPDGRPEIVLQNGEGF